MNPAEIDLFQEDDPFAPGLPGWPVAWGDALRVPGVASYRYTLWRHICAAPQQRILLVVGLNPSTATAESDDATIRVLRGRCVQTRYTDLVVCNLFGYQLTDSRRLEETHRELSGCIVTTQRGAVGRDNDHWLVECARVASDILLAWGTLGGIAGRDREVLQLLEQEAPDTPRWTLGTTQAGHPRHPLRIPYSQPLVPA